MAQQSHSRPASETAARVWMSYTYPPHVTLHPPLYALTDADEKLPIQLPAPHLLPPLPQQTKPCWLVECA